jgi:hypothetical protein
MRSKITQEIASSGQFSIIIRLSVAVLVGRGDSPGYFYTRSLKNLCFQDSWRAHPTGLANLHKTCCNTCLEIIISKPLIRAEF